MKVLMIIPAYNEALNIKNTIKSIENYKEIKVDYLVVNDGSLDNTLEVLEKNNINHLNLANNLGIGASVQTGYKYAYYNNYDIAVQFDGDGQHDITYLKDLIEPIVKKQADFTIGSRFIDSKSEFLSTKTRRMGISLLSNIIYLLTRKRIKDTTSGYRAANRDVIKLFAKSYPFDYPEPITNLKLLKQKYKVLEVPVNMKERENGKSSITSFKSITYMINVCLSMVIICLGKED